MLSLTCQKLPETCRSQQSLDMSRILHFYLRSHCDRIQNSDVFRNALYSVLSAHSMAYLSADNSFAPATSSQHPMFDTWITYSAMGKGLIFLRPWKTQRPVPPLLCFLLAGHMGLDGRCSGMSNSKSLGLMSSQRGTAFGTSHHSRCRDLYP